VTKLCQDAERANDDFSTNANPNHFAKYKSAIPATLAKMPRASQSPFHYTELQNCIQIVTSRALSGSFLKRGYKRK